MTHNLISLTIAFAILWMVFSIAAHAQSCITTGSIGAQYTTCSDGSSSITTGTSDGSSSYTTFTPPYSYHSNRRSYDQDDGE